MVKLKIIERKRVRNARINITKKCMFGDQMAEIRAAETGFGYIVKPLIKDEI
jgi:hypothetical protein